MSGIVNYDRQDLIALVREAKEKTPEELKNLSQAERKTLQKILTIFKSKPNLKVASLDGDKFRSLEERLKGIPPEAGKESWITNLFQKMRGTYIHTDAIREELEETIDSLYGEKSTSFGGIDMQQALKNAASNYTDVVLLKLKDNLEGLPQQELLRKAKGTLKGEILPKLQSDEISLDVRFRLEVAKSEFETFIAALEKETPPVSSPPLAKRQVMQNPQVKHVRFAEAVQVIPHDTPQKTTEPPLGERVSAGDPSLLVFKKALQRIGEEIRSGHVFAAIGAIEIVRNQTSVRLPEHSQALGKFQQRFLDVVKEDIGKMVQDRQLPHKTGEVLIRAIELLSNSDIPLETRIKLKQQLQTHPEGQLLERLFAERHASLKPEAENGIEQAAPPKKSPEQLAAESRIIASESPVIREPAAPQVLHPMGREEAEAPLPQAKESKEPWREVSIEKPNPRVDALFYKNEIYVDQLLSAIDKIKRENKGELKLKKAEDEIQVAGESIKIPRGYRAATSLIRTRKSIAKTLDAILKDLNSASFYVAQGFDKEKIEQILQFLEEHETTKSIIDHTEEFQKDIAAIKRNLESGARSLEVKQKARYQEEHLIPEQEAKIQARIAVPLPDIEDKNVKEMARLFQGMFDTEINHLLESYAVPSPKALLLTYKYYTDSPTLMKGAVAALSNPAVSEEQKMAILSFCEEWLKFPPYAEDAGMVANELNEIIDLANATSEEMGQRLVAARKEAEALSKTKGAVMSAPQALIDETLLSKIKEGTASQDEIQRLAKQFAKERISDQSKIPVSECFEGDASKKRGSDYKVPHLKEACSRSNQISEDLLAMLKASSPRERAYVVQFFLELAKASVALGDFDTANVLTTTLCSGEIDLMIRHFGKETTDRGGTPLMAIELQGEEKRAIEEARANLENLFFGGSNQSNLRRKIADYRAEGRLVIPPLGILLKDITFANDGNPDLIMHEDKSFLNVGKLNIFTKILAPVFEDRANFDKHLDELS